MTKIWRWFLFATLKDLVGPFYLYDFLCMGHATNDGQNTEGRRNRSDEHIQKKRFKSRLPHMLTWMEDSRPGNLTQFCVKSDVEIENTKILRLDLKRLRRKLYPYISLFNPMKHVWNDISSKMWFLTTLTTYRAQNLNTYVNIGGESDLLVPST